MRDQERIEYFKEQIARLSNQVVDLQNERDALAAQVGDAFGDGYYDGFLDGAKHHEQTDCNTSPCYLGDDAMRRSEIAEGEKLNRLGASKKQQHLAQIRAEAGRTGFVEGVSVTDSWVNGERGLSDESILKMADEYAAKVRQGGDK